MHTKEFFGGAYKTLLTIRLFETRAIQLYRQGLVRGYLHPYLGEEAIATGVCAALEPRDYIVSTHRGHGHCIARGAEIGKMFAELFGRATGYCAGRGGSMHIADVSAGNLGANSIVGGGISLGVGAALGTSIRGEDQVTTVFLSDGASNNGVFCESMNLAAIWNLPLILVIENNQYAVSTPIEQSTREPELYKRGPAYGVTSSTVDGNHVLEVYERACEAFSQCRAGQGPVLMEAKTYRHAGHHVNDPGLYMPEESLEYYKSKDPVVLGRKLLLEEGGAAEEEAKTIETAVEQEVEAAVEFAKRSPEPSVEEFLESMVNQAAKYHLMTGGLGRVPLVVRTQGGSGTTIAAQHSQSLEARFYHIPGLKVAMPTTPYDAKGLLKSAIRDDAPVIFIEHKLLYTTTGEVPSAEYLVPLGRADLKRPGRDVTLIAWSNMVPRSLAAAEKLAGEGIEVEVVDPRTLVPLDKSRILQSVRKTQHVVIVQEAVRRGGVASDIASIIQEEAFDYLDAPIEIVAGKNTPIPFNMKLESACVPEDEDIVRALKRAMYAG